MRDLAAACTDLLARVVDGWEEAGGMPLPARQYVAAGALVAFDDEQVTVNVARVFAGRPGQELQVLDPYEIGVVSAVLQVLILRTAPVPGDDGGAPTVGELNASSAESISDMVTLSSLLLAVSADRSAGAILPAGVPCLVGPVLPVGPEGGMVGTQGLLTFQAV